MIEAELKIIITIVFASAKKGKVHISSELNAQFDFDEPFEAFKIC